MHCPHCNKLVFLDETDSHLVPGEIFWEIKYRDKRGNPCHTEEITATKIQYALEIAADRLEKADEDLAAWYADIARRTS